MFILGLQCGIEGAYFTAAQGAPAYSGVFTAWCDLREITPYAFGYMMAAKVGTGIVAELGAMRISDEIDALEVMGINSMTFLCATRLLAAWLVLPFMYLAGDRRGLPRLLHRRRAADRLRLLGRLLPDLLAVPEPAGLLIQPHQGDVHGHRDRARGLLLRLQRQRRARRRGQGDGQVDGAQPRARARHRRCSARRSSGAPTREPRSGAERWPSRSRAGVGPSTSSTTSRSSPTRQPRARATRSSSSTCTSPSGATTCCAA